MAAAAGPLPWGYPMVGNVAAGQQLVSPLPVMTRPKPPTATPLGAPLCPDLEVPPQPQRDSAPEDGPISVAYGFRPTLGEIRPQWPCPNTAQYLHRGATRRLEREILWHPRQSVDIAGWVVAAATEEEAEEQHRKHLEHMHLHHNAFRLAFQCISGWALMLWRSEEDFTEGIHGGRRAPRAMAWLDMRKAFDVHVEVGDRSFHLAAHRFTIMMHTGNYYFCVELPEDVPVWLNAIRRLIQDASWQSICAKDTEAHQRKRWIAACGVADTLFVHNAPIGERAMAILFHAYDIDFDCYLRVGEIMVLIQELIAALIHDEGHAEGRERGTAIASAASRVSEDELFDRAMVFRRQCCPYHDGKVRKDEFVRLGPAALSQAVGASSLIADLGETFEW
eukprot:CAMPEP_0115588210 /NCGR_PEP_ID=MMETSP0272-20121206/8598_1 /TAXON_ID=71861 /ORGANISM="Scrippsiella trochoidea, Strain CCMP3099" /LENGTH=391 /DNA_ID=CAMNT_0003023301 /DNA_START=28 /DNA_END=1200 /DNA_ORIENTATION=-